MERHPLAEWLDAGDDKPPGEPAPERATKQVPRPRRRRWLLRAAAALPWAVLGGVLVGAVDAPAGQDGGAPGAGAGAEADAPDRGDSAAQPRGDALPTPVAAAAAVAVRDHVNGAVGAGRRYADLVLPDGGERLADVWVARVVAVVLEGDDEAWSSTRLRRYAVPVDDAARVLEAPWRLPEPRPSEPGGTTPGIRWDAPPASEPREAGEVTAAVTAELRDAGYAVGDLVLARSGEVAGVLRAAFDDDGEARAAWLVVDPEVRLLGGVQPAR